MAAFQWKPFLKKLAVLAIPVALQNLLTTTGSMVDTMMLANLGENTVGAVGLCAQFTSLMFSCYWGFIGGGMLFYAQYWGNHDHDGINRSYGLTTTFLMFVGFTFALLAIAFPETIMSVYTDKEVIREIGVKYLHIVGWSYPLSVFAVGMSALLRSTERVKIPMYGAIGGVATNILLNYVLINGKLGFPAMGVTGAAVATVCSSAVNAGIVLVIAAKKKDMFLFSFSRHFRWSGAFLKEYLQKCFPIICNELLIGVGNMVINMVLGRQSEEAIAATAVLRVLEGLVIGFFAGFSNAASVLVGKEVGAGNLNTAFERAKRLIYCCGGFILIVCVALIAVHTPLLHTLGLSGEAFNICYGMLLIYCAAAVIRMLNWCLNDTYRSAGDAAFGTILEITFMYLLVLPCVYLTGMVWKTSFLLIFAMCYIDEPIRNVMMQYHLHTGRWIKPVTPEGQAALPAFRTEREQHFPLKRRQKTTF